MDIQNLILPLDSLPRIYSDAPLVNILSNTKSSHDAVLVYDKKNNQFAGIAYPYNMLYRRRPNINATAGSVLFNPPQISSSTSGYEILRLMMSLRLYTLPIMNGKTEPIGIVTAKDIIRSVLENSEVAKSVMQSLPITEPLLVDKSAKIRDIYSFMRNKQISRVIIHDNDGLLEGILTRRDIYIALLSPAPNHRFKKQGGKSPSAFFDKEWITQLDYPAETYMTREVVSAIETESRIEIINKLFLSDKNAIVITNSRKQPVGVISTRSIISTVLSLQPENIVNSVVTDKNNILSAFRRQEIEQMLDVFSKKIAERMNVKKIELVIEPISKNKRSIKLYDVKTTITQTSGKDFRSYAKEYRLRDAVHASTSKLLKQIDRQ